MRLFALARGRLCLRTVPVALCLALASLHAAFDSAREREKANWTNELPYPIDTEISSQNWAMAGKKGLRSKDLRRIRGQPGTNWRGDNTLFA
ncbi:hypothetical protein [Paraburkholderia adhaesiva]|uniref:hypothetical protein n=1 Tax=Paraburkholderia adhaesiva TaxID=2883244 RepID=UPI001F437E51|nr:hypothetical protein [Paraburkholderia adhaesiva]